MAEREAPVIDQIRAHRKFLRLSDQASEAGIDYPRTRKAGDILSAKDAPSLSGALRKRAKARASEY